MSLQLQCDQMTFTVFIICPFKTMKYCPKFAEVVNIICQILNKPL